MTFFDGSASADVKKFLLLQQRSDARQDRRGKERQAPVPLGRKELDPYHIKFT